MTLTEKSLAALFITASLLFASLFFAASYSQPVKAAGGFLPATIATSSAPAVTTTAALVFATSTCSARVITTTASPIMIGFSDVRGFVPTGLQGHLQPASTTVAYDSGLYGCGAYRIYSFVASTITVSESR